VSTLCSNLYSTTVRSTSPKRRICLPSSFSLLLHVLQTVFPSREKDVAFGTNVLLSISIWLLVVTFTFTEGYKKGLKVCTYNRISIYYLDCCSSTNSNTLSSEIEKKQRHNEPQDDWWPSNTVNMFDFHTIFTRSPFSHGVILVRIVKLLWCSMCKFCGFCVATRQNGPGNVMWLTDKL
jgi:hypothetical protein